MYIQIFKMAAMLQQQYVVLLQNLEIGLPVVKPPTIEESSVDATCPGLSTVESVVDGGINQQINVCGRLTLQGPKQTILKNEKTLLMQEAALTDEAGSIRVVLWENDTN